MSIFIPYRSFNAILSILNGEGADKHGDEWKTRPDHIDMDAFHRHLLKYDSEDSSDFDITTGDLHLSKAVCRLILRLERRLIKDEVKSDE